MPDDRAGVGTQRKLLRWANPILLATDRLLGVRRPFLVPGISLPARPGLLLLTTLLLCLLWLLLLLPGRPPSGANDEFALLSDPSFSNLNNTSAKAPLDTPAPQPGESSPETAAVEPASHESPPARVQVNPATDSEAGPAIQSPKMSSAWLVPERLAAPTVEPALPPPAELPRRLVAEDSLPIFPAALVEPAREDCYPIRNPHQGDTPMMRTWKMLGLKTLLAGMFAATPVLASNTSGPPSDGEKLEEIQKQLNELKNALVEVRKALADVRTDSNLATQRIQGQFGELNNQMNQLRMDVDSLRNHPSNATRISASPPSDIGLGTGTARIEMTNTYSQPVSIVINNRRSYVLAPGERRLSDPVPAGAFTYEVLGVTPMVTRNVAADKVFSLWIHPQP